MEEKTGDFMDDLNLNAENDLNITEELKYMVGNRFKLARNTINLSRQKLVDHEHFKHIFGCYSIYKIKEIENGFFGKRNVKGEFFKFLNGMSRFFNVPPKCFIDPVISRSKFGEIIQKGANEKYSVFQIPADEFQNIEKNTKKNKFNKTILKKNTQADWGDAPDISVFYGRENELADLKKWIIDDRCRIAAILGIRGAGKTRLSLKLCSGGIGKTDISLKLAQEIKSEFDYVIWRKLLNAPGAQEIIEDILKFISDSLQIIIPESFDKQLGLLHQYLKNFRCLIILDNLESILKNNSAGEFKDGYEEYEQIFQLMGQGVHQSCLLITSREKPKAIALMEGKIKPVRSMNLNGLTQDDGQKIFNEIGQFSGSDQDWAALVNEYDGNPLALELAARHIDEVFFGDISDFLKHGTPVFDDLKDLLNWHVERLLEYEKEIMFWLAILREPATLPELRENILSPDSKEHLSSTLQSLQRRMILERSSNKFSLQPVLMEYLIDRLISDVFKEIQTEKLKLLYTHPLITARAKDYIRETQISLIIEPLIQKLNLICNTDNLDHKFKTLISIFRTLSDHEAGYGPGNILNLLCNTNNESMGFDFSCLVLREVYLAGKMIRNTNFSGCTFENAVFTQAFSDLLCLAFSPDGKLIAAGDSAGIIHLWEAESGQKINTLTGHLGKVWAAVFSPDGRVLASASTDENVRLWSVCHGECLEILSGHTSLVNDLAFSPDGNILASCGRDKTVKLWDIGNNKCVANLKDHENWVWGVEFSPDGKKLASCCHDGNIRIWDINSLSCVYLIKGHDDSVNSLAFSHDGTLLACASTDKNISIWDVDTWKQTALLKGHLEMITSVVFHPKKNLLLSSGRDQTIRMWDVKKSCCTACLYSRDRSSSALSANENINKIRADGSINNLRNTLDTVRSLALSPDGEKFVSCGTGQQIKIWDTKSQKLLNSFQGYTNWIKSIVFSPDGQTLASCDAGCSIKIWDIFNGTCSTVIRENPMGVLDICFSLDGKKIVSVGNDCKVRVWDISDGKCIDSLNLNSIFANSVAFDPLARKLAYFGWQEIFIWDILKGRILMKLKTREHGARSARFSSDGALLFTCEFDHSINVWDMKTGDQVKTMKGFDNQVRTIFLSSDGKIMAGCGYDSRILLWDIEAEKFLNTLCGHSAWIRTVSFSPDNKTLATGGDDHSIRMWDIKTGECINICEGHNHWIWSVVFSPDGKILASGSEDETIKLWNPKTGEIIKTLRYPRPYEGMNITGVTGLTQAQKAGLEELGAIYRDKACLVSTMEL